MHAIKKFFCFLAGVTSATAADATPATAADATPATAADATPAAAADVTPADTSNGLFELFFLCFFDYVFIFCLHT